MKVIKNILYISIFTIFLSNLSLQAAKISGTIRDENTGKPVIGANVQIKAESRGAATNKYGHFRLRSIPRGKYNLSISMMGYESKSLQVNLKNKRHVKLQLSLKPTMIQGQEVVVTGTRQPSHYMDTPVKTQVVSKFMMEKSNPVNLSEALSYVPSVSVDNSCQNCNFTELRMLGMGSKYSQILINSNPVVSSLAGVYGLEHFPSSMISQLEVVKGGTSALYGSGAVAGVVNLITKKPNMDRIHFNSNIRNTGGALDQTINATAEITNGNKTSGGYIYASSRKRDHYDHNGDGYSELGEIQNQTIGFNWYLEPSSQTKLSTHLHRIHARRRGGNDFEKPVHEANIAESVEHWRWGGKIDWKHSINQNLNYDAYYSFALLNRDSYYGGIGSETNPDSVAALKAYGRTNNPLHVGGVRVNYNLGSHTFMSGVQLKYEKLEDRAVRNPLYHLDKEYNNIGIYLQDEIDFNRMEIILGSRMDKNSALNSSVFSPRLNVKYDLGQAAVLRAGISTGFKAPQIYNEDLHICGVAGGQKVIRNSDDLEEEKSVTGNMSFDYLGEINTIPVKFNLATYYTELTGAFTQISIENDDPKINLWERRNGESATIQGVETELRIRPNKKFTLNSNFTYKIAQYENEQKTGYSHSTKQFLRTPKLSGDLLLDYNFLQNLAMNLGVEYTGKMKVPHAGRKTIVTTPDFIVYNVGLQYDPVKIAGIDYKIKTGIKNVTNTYQNDLDRGANRDPGYVYGPTLPRTYFVDFAFSL